jgi:large subunit ribosomal protein L25
MSDAILNAATRELCGKKNAKQLRREGKVPAIYYAREEKNVLLTVDRRELINIISMESGLVDLKVNKQKPKKVIVKDVQFDPISNSPIHIDLMGINMKEKIRLPVSVHIIGEAIGIKLDGGILNQVLHEVEISCLPLDLPENIEIDVSNLKIGDAIHIKDLHVEKADIMNDPENLVVSVIASRASKETVVETTETEVADEEQQEE